MPPILHLHEHEICNAHVHRQSSTSFIIPPHFKVEPHTCTFPLAQAVPKCGQTSPLRIQAHVPARGATLYKCMRSIALLVAEQHGIFWRVFKPCVAKVLQVSQPPVSPGPKTQVKNVHDAAPQAIMIASQGKRCALSAQHQ